MIRDQSVLALVPARGGSKGLPGKNLRLVGPRSLVAWAADAASGSRYVDRAVLSTDDDAIRDEGVRAGLEAPFPRPARLATDEAATVDVALHALDELGDHDLLVLLQPTSPLRNASDVDACIERCVELGAPACVSVTLGKPVEWSFRLDASGNGVLDPVSRDAALVRRQESLPVHALNGAVYVVRTAVLKSARTFVPPGAVGYEMPKGRSVDVDTEEDLVVADALYRWRAGGFDRSG